MVRQCDPASIASQSRSRPSDLEPDSSPIARLVNAILLSSLKKGAAAIAIRRVDGIAVVDFKIAAEEVREMDPPSDLLEHRSGACA